MSATPAANPSPSEPPQGDVDAAPDFRGSRRLVGAEEWFWYLAAAISYILLGIWHKWLLNWFVGPVWLVAIIVIGPWLTDRIGLTGRSRATTEPPAGDRGESASVARERKLE